MAITITVHVVAPSGPPPSEYIGIAVVGDRDRTINARFGRLARRQ